MQVPKRHTFNPTSRPIMSARRASFGASTGIRSWLPLLVNTRALATVLQSKVDRSEILDLEDLWEVDGFERILEEGLLELQWQYSFGHHFTLPPLPFQIILL